MQKYDKSLMEVWEWKDNFYQDTKELSLKETVARIRKEAKGICEKYNLRLKKIQLIH